MGKEVSAILACSARLDTITYPRPDAAIKGQICGRAIELGGPCYRADRLGEGMFDGITLDRLNPLSDAVTRGRSDKLTFRDIEGSAVEDADKGRTCIDSAPAPHRASHPGVLGRNVVKVVPQDGAVTDRRQAPRPMLLRILGPAAPALTSRGLATRSPGLHFLPCGLTRRSHPEKVIR
jgi:hypothetical protein